MTGENKGHDHLHLVPKSPTLQPLSNSLKSRVKRDAQRVILTPEEEITHLKRENIALMTEVNHLAELYADIARINVNLRKGLTEVLGNAETNHITTQKLEKINAEIALDKIDTTLKALNLFALLIVREFLGISVKIVLSPIQDAYEKNIYLENLIARALVNDMEIVEGMNYRTHENATLFSFLTNTVQGNIPKNIPTLNTDALITRIPGELCHILTQNEIDKLNSAIFGIPRSALAYNIPELGIELFLIANDPDRFNGKTETHILNSLFTASSRIFINKMKEENSRKDPLTDLLRRDSFEARAYSKIDEALKNRGDVSIAFIDIDHFKQINDTYGHAIGDEILQYLSNKLSNGLRNVDICRWGGEEFIVLMPESATNLKCAIERLRKELEHTIFQVNDNGSLSIITSGPPSANKITFHKTFSAGIGSIKEVSGRNTKINRLSTKEAPEGNNSIKNKFDQVIRLADERMYHAKKSGRNKVVSK